MALIGLMAIKGSGKTTSAAYLVEKYGFIEKPFAECLKKACQNLFLLGDEQILGSQEQKETPDNRWFGCTPRKMVQFVGTDLLRDRLDEIMPGLGKNIFVHHFMLWYSEELLKNPNIRVVISDVRFQNEIEFIQSLGGTVIKIEKAGLDTSDMHQSELELQNIETYDCLIENNYAIEYLYLDIDRAICRNLGIAPIQ